MVAGRRRGHTSPQPSSRLEGRTRGAEVPVGRALRSVDTLIVITMRYPFPHLPYFDAERGLLYLS